MKKMMGMGIIILFIGCSVQPENKSINNSSEREIESNIDNDFNKKLNKLSTLTKPIKKSLTRDISKQVVIDENTNLMWQDNKDIPKKNWNRAKSHCNNLQFASFSDWRLPNMNELFSITDDTRYRPAIDRAFRYCYSAFYWSNFRSDAFIASVVDFTKGNGNGMHTDSSVYLRCVRDI